MKRGTRPFIVEVRRGQKRPLPTESEGENESNLLRNDALRRAEVALFGTAPTQPQPAQPKPEPPPKPRRILASLNETGTLAGPVVEPESQRQRGRRPRTTQQLEKPARGRRRHAEKGEARTVPLTPELVNAALDTINKATLDGPRRRNTGSSSPHGHSAASEGSAGKRVRARRKEAKVSAGETKGKREFARVMPPPQQSHSENKQRAVHGQQQMPSSEAFHIRRPSIRGRYVFGTELKPGERWKRRLRRGR